MRLLSRNYPGELELGDGTRELLRSEGVPLAQDFVPDDVYAPAPIAQLAEQRTLNP